MTLLQPWQEELVKSWVAAGRPKHVRVLSWRAQLRACLAHAEAIEARLRAELADGVTRCR